MPVIARLSNRSDPQRPRRRRLRTVAALPTLLTLGNLVCGIAAIHYCMSAIADAGAGRTIVERLTLHSYRMERLFPSFISVSGLMILVGMVFDMVDGRVARITNRTSNFGGQLDSLADMVTFGVAPAVLMITMLTRLPEADLVALFPRAIWVVGAIYACCTAMRLARFNVEHVDSSVGHKSFHGLPSPGSAAVVATLVVLHQFVLYSYEYTRGALILANVLPYIVFISALLMVSNVRYSHIGNRYLRGRWPFEQVVLFVIVLGVFLWHPIPVLAAAFFLYAASGPVNSFFRRLHSARDRSRAAASGERAEEGSASSSDEKTA